MSKIWDALKKAESERAPLLQRDAGGGAPRLTAKQRAAVRALRTCASHAEAAAACGITERTLLRWSELPAFAAAYHSAGRAELGEALAQITVASREATEVLRRALTDSASDVRVRAAAALVDAASRFELATAIRSAARTRKP